VIQKTWVTHGGLLLCHLAIHIVAAAVRHSSWHFSRSNANNL